MIMKVESLSTEDWKQKYREGFRNVYPESHIIRVYHQILDWELNLQPGKVFDFGCGTGGNLKFFADQSFTPHGCDISDIAIEHCQSVMPEFKGNFIVSNPRPDLTEFVEENSLQVFLSNQVFFCFDDGEIHDLVRQAYAIVKPGGTFIVSIPSHTCWYINYVTEEVGDFKKVDVSGLPRPQGGDGVLHINFKEREELEELFKPFRKLHIGSYGSHLREEEGSTDHWLYVGIKD